MKELAGESRSFEFWRERRSTTDLLLYCSHPRATPLANLYFLAYVSESGEST